MTAYYIASPEVVTDPEGMRKYVEGSGPVLEQFGGRYLVHHGAAEHLAGSWTPEFIVLMEFPSRERMHAWYESAEYRPWRELRERSSKATIVATEE